MPNKNTTECNPFQAPRYASNGHATDIGKKGSYVDSNGSGGFSFWHKYKEVISGGSALIVLAVMLLGYINALATDDDISDVKVLINEVRSKHDRDYELIDNKLDKIYYLLMSENSDTRKSNRSFNDDPDTSISKNNLNIHSDKYNTTKFNNYNDAALTLPPAPGTKQEARKP